MASAGPPFTCTSTTEWPLPQCRNTLRVGSYNIQVDHDRDTGTEKEWKHRRGLAAAAVKRLDCDLLLIQEPGPRMAADMNVDLNGDFVVAVNSCDPVKWAQVDADPDLSAIGQAYDGNGFIWRASRMQLLGDPNTIWFSTTPDEPDGPAWDSSPFNRTCVEARFQDLQTGHIWHCFSAHLDHSGKEARVESAKLVMDRAAAAAADENTTVVVAGDFNTFPEPSAFGPQTYAALAAAAEPGFVDVRASGADLVDFGVGEDSWKGWEGQKFCRAENKAAYPHPELGQDVSRFDQMFVQITAAVQRTGVVEEDAWASASDHVPIIAEFTTSQNLD